MSSVLILFGLYSSCGGGGGGGGSDPCAPAANIDGVWFYDIWVVSASGNGCTYGPGDYIYASGQINQSGKTLTYLSDFGEVYTGSVCQDDMDLYFYGPTFPGSSYDYEDAIVGFVDNPSYMYGDGYMITYNNSTGVTVCSVAYVWDGYAASLIGGGDGENGASVFNYDDAASAFVFARSTEDGLPRIQVLGTVPPGEAGDFPLPPGYWDLYMTYPGEHSRHFELAR